MKPLRSMLLLVILLTGISFLVSESLDARTTITVLDAWGAGPWAQALYKEWGEALKARYPEIEVKFVLVPPGQDTKQKLLTMVAGGIPPDITLGSDLDLALQGLFMNLKPMYESDPETKNRKYFPACEQYVRATIDDEEWIWAMPGNTHSQPLWVNLDLFDEAGIPWASSIEKVWSWTDFITYARKLTRDLDGDGKIDQWGFVPWFWYGTVNQWSWTNGGEFFHFDPKTGWADRCTMDDPKVIGTIQWLADLALKYKVAPVPGAPSPDFRSGKVAMTQGWEIYLPPGEKLPFKWDMMYPPAKERGTRPASIANSSQMGSILKTCKNVEEAWKVLKYLSGDDGDWIRVKYMPHIPALMDSKYLMEWVKSQRPLHREIMFDMCQHGRMLPRYKIKYEISKIEEEIDKGLNPVWQGKVAVENAVTSIVTKVNYIIKSSFEKEKAKK